MRLGATVDDLARAHHVFPRRGGDQGRRRDRRARAPSAYRPLAACLHQPPRSAASRYRPRPLAAGVAPVAVPTLDLGAETRPEPALFTQLDARLPGKGTSERRPADQPEVDEDFPEPLTSLDLSLERELDLAVG